MPLSVINSNNNTFRISYKIYNLDKKTNMIILHGWGSNKEIMEKAFASKDALKQYKLVFIDLPGFGKSDNNYTLDTTEYSQIIDKFLQKMNIQKDIIIGHSFGGKIATLLKPSLLVLLSSAGIVNKKSLKIRAKIFAFKIIKYIGFGFLYKAFASKDVKNMSVNMYKTFKNVVDEDFSNIFKEFKNKAIIFWGNEDMQTPVANGKSISSLINQSEFINLDGEHFFFASKNNSNIIVKKINQSYTKI